MEILSSNILKSDLFCGVSEDDIKAMLSCANAYKANFEKGEYIARCGEKWGYMAVVIGGSIFMLKDSRRGDRFIISHISEGECFGASFARMGKRLPVSFIARERSEILVLECDRVMQMCENESGCHKMLLKNILNIISNENIRYIEKMECLSQKSTKGKLVAYISQKAAALKKDDFYIALNRQELADYLAVDRSAMSAVLSKMQKRGELFFEKSHFKLGDKLFDD